MNNRTAIVCVTSMVIAACASAPPAPDSTASDASSGTSQAEHTWSYEVPPEVSQADATECKRLAEEAAHAAVSGMSDRPAVLFGAIGALVQISRAKRKMNAAYEETIRACLRERGYPP